MLNGVWAFKYGESTWSSNGLKNLWKTNGETANLIDNIAQYKFYAKCLAECGEKRNGNLEGARNFAGWCWLNWGLWISEFKQK